MKKYYHDNWKTIYKIILGFILYGCNIVSGQDTIVLINGNKLIVEINEIRSDYVFFSMWPDSTNITKLPIDRVQSISRFDDNEFSAYFDPEVAKSVMQDFPKDSAAITTKATAEANKTYKGSTGTAIATLFATVIGTPVIGTLVAVTASSTPPAYSKLTPPHKAMLNDKIYRKEYQKQAHKIKQRKVWIAFGVGVVIDAILVVLIVNSINNMEVGY